MLLLVLIVPTPRCRSVHRRRDIRMELIQVIMCIDEEERGGI